MRKPVVYLSGNGGEREARHKRLILIDQEIRSGRFPNATSLGRLCGCTSKTIHRDLAVLRDELAAPIRYDASRMGYHYTREFGIPALALSEADLFALAVAENAVSQYAGTPLARDLRAVMDRVLKLLPGPVRAQHELAQRAIRFGGMPPAVIRPEVWSALLGAIQRRERVELHYRRPGEAQTHARSVEPHLLLAREREWYLAAWLEDKQVAPLYYLARVEAVRPIGQTFPVRAEFAPENYNRLGFNAMHAGGQAQLVELRFPPAHAHLVDERPWAETQQVSRHRDGSVTLRFETHALFEVVRHVLRYGGVVEARRPPALRRAVAEGAEKLLEHHRS